MDTIEQEPHAEVIDRDPPAPPLTKGDLAKFGMDALDRGKVASVAVAGSSGIMFTSVAEVMEVAKLMAVSGSFVPKHLRLNPGACLGICFQAVEWKMSPFSVANKSYSVNDRIAYESQLLHAVVEARAPLRERLDCTYAGDGPTRSCTIIGRFRDGTERTYTSPAVKDIKVKNSPLWTADPDQQLFYYASRAWSRRWTPDVLMGLYTPEELAALPRDEPEEPPPTTFLERIKAADRTEGHREGHAAEELARTAAEGQPIKPADAGDPEPAGQPQEPDPKPAAEKTPAKPAKAKEPDPPRATTLEKGKPATKRQASAAADRAANRSAASKAKEPAKPEQQTDDPPKVVPKEPKTAAEYQVYAEDWINRIADPEEAHKRWGEEHTLRDACVVRIPMRNHLRELLEKKHGV